MSEYRVTDDSTSRIVREGDIVTDFRGDPGVFQRVTRGPEYNGTAKVQVDGREYYARVFGLTVTPINA